jgi:mRNA interferase RelE/StbE
MRKKRTGSPKYFVDTAPRCIDQLKQIPKDIRELILDRIDDLGFDPKPSGFEPLKGGDRGLYRIRQGDYRIVYSIHDQKLLVLVVRVAHRREVYKKKYARNGL